MTDVFREHPLLTIWLLFLLAVQGLDLIRLAIKRREK